MRKILFILLLLSSGLNAQTFTFECICDYLTAADSNCDICNANIQSRLFKGILIRKNGTAFKWIDQPYIVQFQGNNATFRELIPNGENITITLAGTPFDSIPQYQDSIKCPCAGSDNFFIAGPGIYFSGDTISAFDISPSNELQTVDSFYISAGNLYISLDRDSVPASFVTLPVPTGAETIINAGTGISVTGSGTIGSPYIVTNTLPHIATDLTFSGASSPVTLNSSTGTDVTFTAGTGISLAATSTNTTITNSAPDQTVSITGAGINVVTGTYPNFTVTGTEVGTVASVGLALPTSVFDISGSPVTSSGTLTATFDNQTANTVFAGPTTGGAATPTFRALVAADIPAGIASLWTDAGATTYLTATGDNVAIGGTSATQKLDVTGNIQGSADLYLGTAFKMYDGGTLLYHKTAFASQYLGLGSGNLTATGQGNIGFGRNTLNKATSGGGNVAIGDQALANATSGALNVGIGGDALKLLTTANNNMAIGYNALGTLTTGTQNVAMGRNALNSATTQSDNTGVGFQALGSNAPSESVAIGSDAGTSATDKVQAIYIGAGAGRNSTAATQVDIGHWAGRNSSATNSIFLGYAAGYGNTTNSVFAIDWNSGFTSNKTPLLGGSFANTRVGVNTALSSLAQTLHVTGTARITGSDGTATTVMGRDGDGDISALSLSGMSISAGTLTATDGSVTNEGILGVGAGSGTSSTLLSTTSGANAVTINAAGILAISESTSVNGGSITLTATEVDGSTTNEAQALTISGTTSGIITLASAGGAGGGVATIAAGTGVTVAQSGGTITIASTGLTSATGYINGGNSFGALATIGLNDNFDWAFETNGTNRMWIDNTGPVTIGATRLIDAALNINLLQNNAGLYISGGSGLGNPFFIQTRGNGSGSNCTVLDAEHSMINGNVEATITNTATSGTGGTLLSLYTDPAATGDPKIHFGTLATRDWTFGIDNSATNDPVRLTANTDLGTGTSALTANISNQVGINQNTPLVQFHVTGTDAIGIPTGTTAQRSAAAIPQIRHNNTFSGLEFYDQNKNYWYRLTAVSTPTVASNTAAGTGHSGNVLAGELSSDVRGVLELNTGSASMAVGTVMTVTYASAYSGTKTVVMLDAGNDLAATQKARWRVDTQSNTGFTIRAVTALDINETYVFKYYVGQ